MVYTASTSRFTTLEPCEVRARGRASACIARTPKPSAHTGGVCHWAQHMADNFCIATARPSTLMSEHQHYTDTISALNACKLEAYDADKSQQVCDNTSAHAEGSCGWHARPTFPKQQHRCSRQCFSAVYLLLHAAKNTPFKEQHSWRLPPRVVPGLPSHPFRSGRRHNLPNIAHRWVSLKGDLNLNACGMGAQRRLLCCGAVLQPATH